MARDDGGQEEEDSHLRDSVEGIRKLALGIVGRVLGPESVPEDVDFEKTAVSPEVDAALERMSFAIGSALEDAGRALKARSREGDAGPDHEDEQEESSLAKGAQAFVDGIQVLSQDLRKHFEGEE